MLRALPRLWLCTLPTDMRKQFDGLAALVTQQMGADSLSGQGFVFINRRRTQLKCLYFEEGGYCLWSKRLERGQFARLSAERGSKRALSRAEFEALIEGLDLTVKRRRKRWTKGSPLGSAMVE